MAYRYRVHMQKELLSGVMKGTKVWGGWNSPTQTHAARDVTKLLGQVGKVRKTCTGGTYRVLDAYADPISG